MQLALETKNTRAQKTGNQFSGLKLTLRDAEVIQFITEMKFASVDEVHEKFFKRTQTGAISESKEWALERLRALRRAGLLSAIQYCGEWKALYLTTHAGYYAMSSVNPGHDCPKPATRLETRTFAHDKFVLGFRLELERELGLTEWISDRTLKAGRGITFGLPESQTPDAIYRLPSGERVAFELEIAQKSRARYRDKIRRYVDLIRARRGDTEMFRRVHVLCLKKAPFEAWKSEARIFGELFQVEFRGTTLPAQGGAR